MTPFQQDQLRYINHLAVIGQLMGSGGGLPLAQQIVSITDAGGGSAGQCLITTAGDHGLAGTPPIVVSGNSVAGYNVEHSVESFPSATTMITNQTYTTDGTGGTWVPA